jgi:hypothetical protein
LAVFGGSEAVRGVFQGVVGAKASRRYAAKKALSARLRGFVSDLPTEPAIALLPETKGQKKSPTTGKSSAKSAKIKRWGR